MVIYIFEDDNLFSGALYRADSVIKIGKENKIVKNRNGKTGELRGKNTIKYLLELLRNNELLSRSEEAKLRLMEE